MNKIKLENAILVDYENGVNIEKPGDKGLLIVFVNSTMGEKGKKRLLAKIEDAKVDLKNYMIIRPDKVGKNYNDDIIKMIVMFLECNYSIRSIHVISNDKGFENLAKIFKNISIISK